MAAKRRVNGTTVFTKRGTGNITPLKEYGRPGTFGCAVAEKPAVTGLTEAEYVQIAQKHGTSQNRFKAYIDYFKSQGFNIVLENGRYVEQAKSTKILGVTSQTQARETVLGKQNPIEVNVNIDDKFLKDLKVAVKPECLIGDSIWFDWSSALKGTNIYEKTVLDVAKSKKMIWPESKSEETFGYYLAMQFYKVKNSLGWDAKRTLLLCLAEEYHLFRKNKSPIANATISELKPPEISVTAKASDEIAGPHNTSGLERIELTCANALEIVTELTSNNKINNDLINLLNDHIVRISKENSMLLENKSAVSNNTLHMKHLLDEMIKMSQDQIIDIDDLSKENKRLMSELESYKSKYYELKTNYDRLRIGSYNSDAFNSNNLNKIDLIKMEASAELVKKQPENVISVKPDAKPDNCDDMKFLRSLAVSDYSTDIKI